MNEAENLFQLKALWIGLAHYYSTEISDETVRMYAEDCAHYSAAAIGRAMKSWRMNPKHGRLPLPGQLLESMGGGSSRSNASAIAIALIGAIKTRDYTWPQQLDGRAWKTGSFEGDFKHELGEIAWEVVRMAGGWPKFCDSFWDCGNETAFVAQIRDAIESVITTNRGQVLSLNAEKSIPLSGPTDEAGKSAVARLKKLLGAFDPKDGA